MILVDHTLDSGSPNTFPVGYRLVHYIEGRKDVRVREVVPSDNVASEKAKSFEIDPALRLNLQRRLRGGDDNIVGLYHSHPDHPAEPSGTDLRYAMPLFLYIIISIQRAEYRGQMGCFVLNDDADAFRRELMRVYED